MLILALKYDDLDNNAKKYCSKGSHSEVAGSGWRPRTVSMKGWRRSA